MNKKFTKFDKTNIEEVRNIIQEKLDELSELNIELKLGNTTFDTDSFKTDLHVNIIGADDECVKAFKHNCKHFGFKPSDLGREFTHCAKRYKILGFLPRARKNILLAEYLLTGVEYRFNHVHVLKELNENQTETFEISEYNETEED